MHKTASRKIGILLTCFILLAWAAIVPPSLCGANMHELPDGDMAAVYAYGFSTFTLDGNTVMLDFTGVTLSTWTEIQSMKMGYYLKGGGTAWDNDWTNVSLGTSGTDLVANGFYIEAGFSNITNPATRQLEYVNIGTTSLTGSITADFNSFSGTIGGPAAISGTRLTTLGTATITSSGGGFYLSLAGTGSGSQMGYSFHWASATKTP